MYNEYIANDNKVLLNIKNFTWGHRILSKNDLSSILIEVDKEIAEQYCEEYKLKKEELTKGLEQNNANISTMSENEDGTYIEQKDFSPSNAARIELVSEILTKYDTSKNITCIKHE